MNDPVSAVTAEREINKKTEAYTFDFSFQQFFQSSEVLK